MAKTPKPQREGQRGGMNHTSSGFKTVKRGGDANRTGGPNKSCLLLVLAGAGLLTAGLIGVVRTVKGW